MFVGFFFSFSCHWFHRQPGLQTADLIPTAVGCTSQLSESEKHHTGMVHGMVLEKLVMLAGVLKRNKGAFVEIRS